MAIKRRYDRRRDDGSTADINLIDTPAKILKFAEQKGLQTMPLDVEGVAEKLGIEIRKEELGGDLSGIFRMDEVNKKWEMLVNRKHHPNRQRYTIAHELAHYCLHRNLRNEFEDQIFFRGSETRKEELQANSFASEILMPEDKFRQLVRNGKNQLDELADEFKVSTLALRIRAKNLGMSGHGL